MKMFAPSAQQIKLSQIGMIRWTRRQRIAPPLLLHGLPSLNSFDVTAAESRIAVRYSVALLYFVVQRHRPLQCHITVPINRRRLPW